MRSQVRGRSGCPLVTAGDRSFPLVLARMWHVSLRLILPRRDCVRLTLRPLFLTSVILNCQAVSLTVADTKTILVRHVFFEGRFTMATTTLHMDDSTELVDAIKNLKGADGRHKLSEAEGLTTFAVMRGGKVVRYEVVDAKGNPADVTFLKMRKMGAVAAEWTCKMCHTHKDGSEHCFPIECPDD